MANFRSGFQSFWIRDAGWAAGASIGTVAATVGLSALLTRVLPPEQYGTYLVASSVVALTAVVGRFGIQRQVVRLLPAWLDTEDTGNNFSPGSPVKVSLTAVVVTASAAAGILISPAGRWLYDTVLGVPALIPLAGLLAAWAAVDSVRAVLVESFRGLHDVRRASLLGDGLRAVVVLALASGLLYLIGQSDFGMVHAVAVAAIGSTTAALVASQQLRRLLRRIGRTPKAGKDGKAMLGIWVASYPILLSDLLQWSLGQADIWIVSAIGDGSDVAIYGVASRVGAFLLLPLVVINGVIASRIAQTYSAGHWAQLDDIVRTGATLALAPAVIGWLLVMRFAEPLLSFLFGDLYGRSANILRILMTGQLLGIAAGPTALTAMMTDNQRLLFRINLVAAATGLATAVYFGNAFGATGVAVAIALAVVGQNLALAIVLKSVLGVWTFAVLSPRRVGRVIKGK